MPPVQVSAGTYVRSVALAVPLALFALVRTAADPSTLLAGDATVDAYGTWWFQWWVAQAVGTGASLTRTDMLFYPWGKEMLAHNGANVLDAIALTPVRALVGAGWSWNLLAFFALAGNGAVAGAWALRKGATLSVALVATTAVVLHPWPLHELSAGRPTQALLSPLLLALAAGDTALREEGRARFRWAVASGIALGVAGWVYWYGALFGAMALGVLALGPGWRGRISALATIAAVTALSTSPALIALADRMASGQVPGLLPVDSWLHGGTDLRTVEGGAVEINTLGFDGTTAFIDGAARVVDGRALDLASFTLLLFAPWRWRLVCALFFVLALGPFPGGHTNPVYLAFAVTVPPARRLYWPSRFAMIFVPAVAIGAGVGLRSLAARRAWAPPAIAGLVLLESLWRGATPLGTWTADVPEPWHRLAGAPGAVIVLPYGHDQRPLVYQTVHQRPMLGGMHERSPSMVPAEQQALRQDNSWLRAVLRAPSDPRAELAWTEADREAVHALGYRWIVLRVDAIAEPQGRTGGGGRIAPARRRLAALAGKPVFESPEVVVFAPWGDTLPP